MNQIYLLANNPNTEFDISKIENSIVCHFNKAIFRNRVYSDNIQYLMVNSFTKLDGTGGYFVPDILNFYNEYYFICSSERQVEENQWKSIREKYINPTIVLTNKFNDSYPSGMVRSVGYSAIKFFESKFDRINLVGFNFSGWEGHDWKFERHYAESNHKIQIIQ